MEIKKYNNYINEVKENSDGFLFNIKCKTCGSSDIIIEANNNLRMGSEFTGLYGDASVVIKCKDCGNAYTITAFEA